jgi:hypothetical protein
MWGKLWTWLSVVIVRRSNDDDDYDGDFWISRYILHARAICTLPHRRNSFVDLNPVVVGGGCNGTNRPWTATISSFFIILLTSADFWWKPKTSSSFFAVEVRNDGRRGLAGLWCSLSNGRFLFIFICPIFCHKTLVLAHSDSFLWLTNF